MTFEKRIEDTDSICEQHLFPCDEYLSLFYPCRSFYLKASPRTTEEERPLNRRQKKKVGLNFNRDRIYCIEFLQFEVEDSLTINAAAWFLTNFCS